ncbi:MAG TPA: hypothetical protein DCL41_04300 [Bdellovibrionales bacterium]|nr:hypothetical protein [Pseudobdellovibrionaceae bacterium]HAG91065.1 hypothetical protein [Bdellovibrionales bacterium]|tara:strand:+ start:3660 stop:4547 length:888 start_codon:yes stop_codon:yes gene_type:complete
MIELNHLRYFYEVAKAGSFTLASRNLRISQSSLSKAVSLLEAREGVELFLRSKTGVELTPLGREVFSQSKEIFNAASQLTSTFRNFKEEVEGTLHFGASDHIAAYLLSPQSGSIARQFPKLVPAVFCGTPGVIAENIIQNKLEFGIFFMKVNAPGIVYESLKEIEMSLVFNPKVYSRKEVKTKKDLVEKVGYIGSIRGSQKAHASPELLSVLGKLPKISAESNSQEMQKRMCLNGAGFAYLARYMVEEEIQSGALAEFPLRSKPTLTLHLARKQTAPLSFNAKSYLKEVGLLAQP